MARSKTEVHHPFFARMYARIGAAAEEKGAAEHRDELLAGLSGRIVEVGAGTGLNFPHYPASVQEVVAVEPEPLLRKLATDAAARPAITVRVMDGVADALPVEDGSFDAGVASLVLCSVPDQASALAELFRVIRPGGELRFYEHVRADTPGFARFQRGIDVVWPLVGGGCHASRDTARRDRAGGLHCGVEPPLRVRALRRCQARLAAHPRHRAPIRYLDLRRTYGSAIPRTGGTCVPACVRRHGCRHGGWRSTKRPQEDRRSAGRH